MLDQRTNQVVRLVAWARVLHDSQCPHETPALIELTFQFRWRRIAIGFVLRKNLRPKGFGKAFIEKHRHILGRHLVHEITDKSAESIECVYRVAGIIDHVFRH